MDLAIDTRWMLDSNYKCISDARVIVEDSKIIYAGSRKAQNAKTTGHDKYEFPKGFLVPAFINGHTHIAETLLRGVCDDRPFDEWLKDYIWQIEPQMTPQDAKVGALLGIAEMISGGTIGFIDQYFYSEQIAEAVQETGVKAFLFPSIFDTPESGSLEKSYHRASQIQEKWHGQDGRIFVGYGPHAPYSIDPETWLKKIYEEATEKSVPLHCHLHETKEEVENARKEWGMTPIQKLASIGILENMLAPHCVHLEEKDFKLLALNNCSVLSCPQSNLKMGAGIAPVPRLLEENVRVCLGTDGQASNNNLDVLEEILLTAIIHKGLSYDTTLIDAKTAFKLATRSPAGIFPQDSYQGVIRIGTRADLTVFDLGKLNTTPVIDPLSNLVFSSSSSNVVFTVCNGDVLFHNGKFSTLNPEEIIEKAQKAAEGMISRSSISDRFNL